MLENEEKTQAQENPVDEAPKPRDGGERVARDFFADIAKQRAQRPVRAPFAPRGTFKDTDKCVHDLGENSTVKVLNNFAAMALPNKKYAVCKYCGAPFEVVDGKLIKKEAPRRDVHGRRNKKEAE